MKSRTGISLVVAGVVTLWIVGMLAEKNQRTTAPTRTTSAQKGTSHDKSGTMQVQRYELLQELIAKDIFEKFEKPGSVPRVWVRPSFYLLDFRSKQAFVGVVYAYYFDGSGATDIVRVIDSYSGKEIGVYSVVYGGLKMK